MTWIRKYQIKAYLKSSLWVGPLIAIVAALATRQIFLACETCLRWTPFGLTESGASAMTGIIAGTMLTFVVFLLTMILLAVQIASAQLTPRIIASAYRDRTLRRSISYFIFAFLFAGGTQLRIGSPVPEISVCVTLLLCLWGIVVIFHTVDHMGKSLRPVSVVTSTGSKGIGVIDAVYPNKLNGNHAGCQFRHDELLTKKPDRVVCYTGKGGVFLAFDAQGLVQRAAAAKCLIRNIPAVGDFVAKGDDLFYIYGNSEGITDEQLHEHVAMGAERTPEQDPGFVFRVIVDIASKALSPAINDPTTAVMAIDQIHHLLLVVGKRDLGDGKVRDASGQLRLVFPTPNWEDFVALGVTEIRLYSTVSIQVLRRLRAMLNQLMEALPECRHEPLRLQLAVLDEAARRNFPDELDQQAARTADFQGLGGARTIGLPPQGR